MYITHIYFLIFETDCTFILHYMTSFHSHHVLFFFICLYTWFIIQKEEKEKYDKNIHRVIEKKKNLKNIHFYYFICVYGDNTRSKYNNCLPFASYQLMYTHTHIRCLNKY